MTNQLYNSLRLRINEILPDLKEWRCEGCDRKFGEYINGCPHCWRSELSREENLKIFPKRGVNLISKPPTLADVLGAINMKTPLYSIRASGRFYKYTGGMTWGETEIIYSLNFPLSEQSEPTLKFLMGILKEE
jgi:hypothetical protein